MEIIGIDKTKVEAISNKKKENDWVKEFRLDSYDKFLNCDMPKFGPNIDLDFEILSDFISEELLCKVTVIVDKK